MGQGPTQPPSSLATHLRPQLKVLGGRCMCVPRVCVQAGVCTPTVPGRGSESPTYALVGTALLMFSHEGWLQAFRFPICKLKKGRASTFQEFARTKRRGSEVAGAAAERAEDGCVTTTSCCDEPAQPPAPDRWAGLGQEGERNPLSNRGRVPHLPTPTTGIIRTKPAKIRYAGKDDGAPGQTQSPQWGRAGQPFLLVETLPSMHVCVSQRAPDHAGLILLLEGRAGIDEAKLDPTSWMTRVGQRAAPEGDASNLFVPSAPLPLLTGRLGPGRGSCLGQSVYPCTHAHPAGLPCVQEEPPSIQQ